jgi:hypothetical protein
MSVIAKVSIRNIHNYGSGSLVELGCVCENDLMAAYAGSEEDKLFTKYSPWGEIKAHIPSGWVMGEVGQAFYVMIGNDLPKDVDLSFGDNIRFWSQAKVQSITDFGDNQAKRLEIIDTGNQRGPALTSFNWKMSVDNPGATDQLQPGSNDYWVAFYPADRFTRDTAIAAFHGRS